MKVNREDTVISAETSNRTSFSFAQTPEMFRMLSDSLYKDKIGSICREIVSNGYDAHRRANVYLPVEVTMPTNFAPQIEFRDYGTGMSEQTVYEVYTTMGESDKRKDDTEIGGFGIGAKTPFAYCDTYTVISRQDGKKVTYSVFFPKNDLPQISKISEEETEEKNGCSIILPVEPKDILSFKNALNAQCAYFKPSLIISGSNDFFHPMGHTIVRPSWALRAPSDNNALNNTLQVVVSEVAYPINTKDIWDIVNLDENQEPMNVGASPPYAFDSDCRVPIDLMIPLSDIELSMSREQLQMTKKTKAAIQYALNSMIKDFIEIDPDFEAQMKVHSAEYAEVLSSKHTRLLDLMQRISKLQPKCLIDIKEEQTISIPSPTHSKYRNFRTSWDRSMKVDPQFAGQSISTNPDAVTGICWASIDIDDVHPTITSEATANNVNDCAINLKMSVNYHTATVAGMKNIRVVDTSQHSGFTHIIRARLRLGMMEYLRTNPKGSRYYWECNSHIKRNAMDGSSSTYIIVEKKHWEKFKDAFLKKKDLVEGVDYDYKIWDDVPLDVLPTTQNKSARNAAYALAKKRSEYGSQKNANKFSAKAIVAHTIDIPTLTMQPSNRAWSELDITYVITKGNRVLPRTMQPNDGDGAITYPEFRDYIEGRRHIWRTLPGWDNRWLQWFDALPATIQDDFATDGTPTNSMILLIPQRNESNFRELFPNARTLEERLKTCFDYIEEHPGLLCKLADQHLSSLLKEDADDIYRVLKKTDELMHSAPGIFRSKTNRAAKILRIGSKYYNNSITQNHTISGVKTLRSDNMTDRSHVYYYNSSHRKLLKHTIETFCSTELETQFNAIRTRYDSLLRARRDAMLRLYQELLTKHPVIATFLHNRSLSELKAPGVRLAGINSDTLENLLNLKVRATLLSALK